MLMEQLWELAATLRGRGSADGAAGGTLGRFAALGGDGDDDDDDDEASQALDDAVAQVDRLQALLKDLDPRWAGGLGRWWRPECTSTGGVMAPDVVSFDMHAHACRSACVKRDLSRYSQPAGMIVIR